MTPWRRRRRDTFEHDCVQLVGEAGAFLEGRLVEWLEDHKLPVPTWAWTNLLAHGAIDQLRSVRGEPRVDLDKRDKHPEWREGRAHLARLMLEASRGCERVLRLQQAAALGPLELILAAQPEPGIASAEGWVRQVQAMLGLQLDASWDMEFDQEPKTGE